MKVLLLSHTAEAARIVAAAAKLCYSDSHVDELLEGLTPEKSSEFVTMLGELGHESPIEHASFTFAIEGVSRTFLAQITRHRIASYSVQSQRYVKLSDFRFVTPPAISDDEEALAEFNRSMEDAAKSYERISQLLAGKYEKEYLEQGATQKEAARKAQKRAIEDARFVLPGACETKMIVTMNARSLHNFFKLRCCSRAQWEIKAVADEMLRLVCEVAPELFVKAGPACVNGACPEGKMSCGKVREMQEFYKSLKTGK